MTGMRFHPRGYGGERRSPDQVKRDGWREQGVLAVAVDDERLSWPERELVSVPARETYADRGRPLGVPKDTLTQQQRLDEILIEV